MICAISWSVKIKVSVITVCFNSAKTIADTLDAVAMQTHTDIDHLVIDGASKDGTLEIVRSHATHQTRLISEPDKGIYDAMNKGLEQATGEVIGFLNSDDFYADAAVLDKIANAFQDPAVDACYADLVYVNHNNSRVVRYWKSKPFTKGDFAKGWCPAHPTFYVRKSVIERLHIAGHARSEGLVLVTNNIAEFARVPALELENWVHPGR